MTSPPLQTSHPWQRVLSIVRAPAAAFCLVLVGPVTSAIRTAHSQPPGARSDGVDPVGTWVWEQAFGPNNRVQRSVSIWRDAGELAGTLRSPRRGDGGGPRGMDEPAPLKNVRLDGDKLSFDVTRRFGPNEFTMHYVGVIAGDEIAGESAANFGGQLRESAWLATRSVPQTDTDADADADADTDTDTPAPAASPVTSESTQLLVPPPMGIPSAGPSTSQPYQPQAIVPGGIVMPLYRPTSPHLDQDRIREAEQYDLSPAVHGRINSIVNIHNPSIEVHFANPAMNTGSVVILAAGGGHRTLNVGGESADFVPYFYNYGINTVILRNRLRSDGYEPTTDAVRDALQAIRLVRRHASLWKLDPQRIGIMGFSAGAELASAAAVGFETFDRDNNDADDPLRGVTSRPDFVGIIYPGPSPFTRSPETAIPPSTPPAFIACGGAGDRIHAMWATDYFGAMLKAGIPNVEMHLYGNGRHPGDQGMTGGLTHRGGIPFGKWQDRFIEWFDDLGFLAAPATPTKAAVDSAAFATASANGNR